MPKEQFKGSCLCGQVRYLIETEPTHFYFCHCEQCRKLSGSAFAANITAGPAPIIWESGVELVHRFDYPGERSFTRVFCMSCGSALPFLNESGTTLYIPAGGLDSALPLDPGQNIFWGDKAPWLEDGLAAPRCEGFP